MALRSRGVSSPRDSSKVWCENKSDLIFISIFQGYTGCYIGLNKPHIGVHPNRCTSRNCVYIHLSYIHSTQQLRPKLRELRAKLPVSWILLVNNVDILVFLFKLLKPWIGGLQSSVDINCVPTLLLIPNSIIEMMTLNRIRVITSTVTIVN